MVRLVPENFRNFKSKREIDRDQLMTVLANVTHLLIRANYNSAKAALYRCVLVRRENLRWSRLLYCIVYELYILCILYFKVNILTILRTQLMELSVLELFFITIILLKV